VFTKALPPVPILNQANPVHSLQPYFPTLHFNVTLPSTLRSSEGCHPFRPPNHFSCYLHQLHVASCLIWISLKADAILSKAECSYWGFPAPCRSRLCLQLMEKPAHKSLNSAQAWIDFPSCPLTQAQAAWALWRHISRVRCAAGMAPKAARHGRVQ
jgi:hypothetical protein